MKGEKFSKLKLQIEAIELINLVKNLYGYSYKELSKILEIPESILCRYANGDLLPSTLTASKIIDKLSPYVNVKNIIKELISVKNGFVNLNEVLFNPLFLKAYEYYVKCNFTNLNITKVLTAATDGIPLAVIASTTLNAKLAIAKPYKDLASDNFYEVSYIVDSPPRKVTLYLPVDALCRGDNVLIVDDIVRTGKTLQALVQLVEKAQANIVAISVLISMRNSWINQLKDKVQVIDIILDLSTSSS